MSSNQQVDVLFLCLARNCAATLPHFFGYLEELARHNVNYHAMLGENGSADGTRELIQDAAHHLPVQLIDTGCMAQEPDRLVRMAIGRQLLLEAARAEGPRPEFVCVADVDNVFAKPIAVEPLLASMERLKRHPELFAVGASSAPYYDVLSLRTETYQSATLYFDTQIAKRKPLAYYAFHKTHYWDPQEAVDTSRPVLCRSSFNGVCLYRSSEYFAASYRGEHERSICEHVTLNEQIAAQTGRQMMISPELRVSMPRDHVRVSFVRFWLDRLRKL